MVIFKQTFKNFLTLKFLIIYFLIFIPLFFAFGSMFSDIRSQNVNMVVSNTISFYFVITFMWTLGIPFLIVTATRGTALIQKEIDDETLVLLVSKPITRLRIYIEKWIASFAISLIIGILSIFLSLLMYLLFFNSDSSILEQMIIMIPSLLIYVVFINFIFTSLSITIVSIFNHRTRAVILLIVIIMLYQLIFPMFKGMIPQKIYVKNHIYLFDINYQFGLMYYIIIQLFSPIVFPPTAQGNINSVIGIFPNMSTDFYGMEDPDLGFMADSFDVLYYVNPIYLFIFWIGLASALVYLAYFLLKKKDIN